MAKNSHEVALNQIMDEARLGPLHFKVWILSAMGVFLDGFDLFIIGVALPVIQHYQAGWHITPAIQGILGIAALVGAVVGSALTGYLTDRYGRKRFYIADMGFVIIAALLCGLSWDIYSLIAFRFILGIAIGADYPISASYVSEFVPARVRGRMLIASFSFQALGMLCAALSGLLILHLFKDDPGVSWRFMLLFVILPSAIVMFLRLDVPESTRWLLERKRSKEAARIIHRFCPAKKKEIEAVLATEIQEIQAAEKHAVGYRALFSPKYLRRTILASVPWFLMDVATYGIGIFTPVILAQIISGGANHNFFSEELKAVEGAAFVDAFLIIGFILNILLVEKLGRIRLQLLGFLGMAAGLGLLGYTCFLTGGASAHLPLILTGFVVFNLLMNMGPNSTTYMLPVELFPTSARATAHGFSAAMAKTGATLGTLLLPILKANKAIGIPGVMFIVAGTAMLGFFITLIFRVETKGKSLDELEGWEVASALEHTGGPAAPS